MNSTGLGATNVIAVHEDIRIIFLLEEHAAIEPRVVFRHGDRLPVDVVLVQPPLPAPVFIWVGLVMVAVSPRCERALFDVAHPLLTRQKLPRPHATLGCGELYPCEWVLRLRQSLR